MSRVGLTPISIPSGVQVTLNDKALIVKGPKGELSLQVNPKINVVIDGETISFKRKDETKKSKSMHGTFKRLVLNMVVGVTDGYKKNLELVGTGYRVQKQGTKLVLALGFSHPVEYQAPSGVSLNIEGNNKIMIEGIDKQAVGQVAAEIRAFRKPEPYKGKGIRYEGEVVRRKAGKAAKA